jgi:hypothetical protein
MLKTHRVVVALAAALVLALVAPVRAADFEKYVPDDTEAIIKLNIKQILASPMLKDAVASLKAGKEGPFKEFGLDPFTDLEHVVIAVPGGGNFEKTVLLLQGKFNTAKIEDAVEKSGKADLKVHKVGANKVFETKVEIPNAPIPPQTFFVCFVDGTTLALAGSKESISDTIDRKDGKKKGALKKEMKDLVSKMDPKLSFGIAILGTVAGLPDFSDRVTSITGGVALVNEVKAEFVIAAKNADTAKELETLISAGLEQVKGLLPVVAADKSQQIKPVVELLDVIKVTSSGSNVMIKAQLSKDDIEKAIKKAGG